MLKKYLTENQSSKVSKIAFLKAITLLFPKERSIKIRLLL